MAIGTAIAIILLCLAVEAFFSGSEIAVVSADPIRLRVKAANGSRGARLALRMLQRPEWLLATTLVGTNIAVVTNTTVATALAIDKFGPQGSWVAVAVVAPLIWIFGEIVPKSVFQQKSDALTPVIVFGLYGGSILFWPILVVFAAISRLLAQFVGGSRRNLFRLRDELRTMLQMAPTEGDIREQESAMIRRLFDFGETTAQEVMRPWLEVAAVPESATSAEAIRVATEHRHQRLPVHGERVDQAVGVIDTLVLIGREPDEPIARHVEPVDFVPGSRSIRDLLVDLRTGDANMSVVVDEVGGAQGIVTTRDIVEEVTDRIQDEWDTELPAAPEIRKLDERDYLVSARVDLEDLEDALGIQLPEGKYATLAGFLLHRIRDIPAEGETVQFEHISFTIHRGTPSAIDEVRIRW